MIRRQDEPASPVAEQQRVLDRLAGLEAVVSMESIQRVLALTGRAGQRDCLLTHEVTLWITRAMGLFTERPICEVKHRPV